jgi:hypothetical protein
MEKLIILSLSIDPNIYALDNGYENWWCVNKITHYEFYYIEE